MILYLHFFSRSLKKLFLVILLTQNQIHILLLLLLCLHWKCLILDGPSSMNPHWWWSGTFKNKMLSLFDDANGLCCTLSNRSTIHVWSLFFLVLWSSGPFNCVKTNHQTTLSIGLLSRTNVGNYETMMMTRTQTKTVMLHLIVIHL